MTLYKNRFDCVIFDLDGTLLYTLPDMAAALNRSLSAQGLPPRELEEVRRFVGNGVARLIARAVPGGEADPAFAAVCRGYDEYYAAHCMDETVPYPGVPELLDALRERGISLGVATNKTHADAERIVRRFFGGAVACTEGKREGRGVKPDPAALRAVMAALGAREERTLYVGDSGVDAETAENAGVACVLALWGYRDEEELARCRALGRICTAAELLDYV